MIASRIKELRLDNNMTQAELASKLSLTPKMVSFYELGKRQPPNGILIKLSKIFGVPVDYLLGLSADSHPTQTKEYTDEEGELDPHKMMVAFASEHPLTNEQQMDVIAAMMEAHKKSMQNKA